MLIGARLQPTSFSFAPAIVDGILRGDRAILAQAIHSSSKARAQRDRELAELIVEDCLPYSGKSIRVGITGVPGAGKSSVIERLGTFLIGGRGTGERENAEHGQEGRRAGNRPQQPTFRRKHSGR